MTGKCSRKRQIAALGAQGVLLDMVFSFLKTTLRRLGREPLYALVGVSGLAVGMACCLLVLRYVALELSFDRHHPAAPRTYRVVLDQAPLTPSPLVALLREEVAGVERVARYLTAFRPLLGRGDRRAYQAVPLADEHLFGVLAFRFLGGDPRTALQAPLTMVLSADLARRIYGRVDVVGETIEWDQGIPLQVTGVVEIPATSHLRFDALVSYTSVLPGERFHLKYHDDWRYRHTAYVVLAPGVLARDVVRRALAAVERNLGVDKRQELEASGFALQPVTDIRLHSHWPAGTDLAYTGSADRVLLLSAIGGFILLLACANFANLATAQSVRRSAELGVRRAIGATRGDLALQSLTETLMLCLLALAAAVALAWVVAPAFSAHLGVDLHLDLLSWPSLAALALVGLATGVLAGTYPALAVPGSRPSHARRAGARRLLVVAQFAIAATLIASTATVERQLEFVRGRDLGLDANQVAVMQIAFPGVQEQKELLVERLLRQEAIPQALGVRQAPGAAMVQSGTFVGADGRHTPMGITSADPGFPDLFGIPLLAGHDLVHARTRPWSWENNEMLLNRAAVRALGYGELTDVLGRRLSYDYRGQSRFATVVGVMEDFHFESLHHAVHPMALSNEWPSGYIAVRLDPVGPGLEQLRQTWALTFPEWPLEAHFVDEAFEAAYRQDQRLGEALAAFAVLAVVIACLGVYALAAFAAQQRTREVGIRKALGAGVRSIVVLFTVEFAGLALAGGVIAAPLAWVAMRAWLDSFAYRAEPGILLFAGSIGLVLLVAVLTTGTQAILAATRNPVDSLRATDGRR